MKQPLEESYYTPKLEDLYVGFECEVHTNNTWSKGKFPEVLYSHRELEEFKDDLMKAAHANIRVAYLNNESIVREGWEELEDKYKQWINTDKLPFIKDKHLITYNFKKRRLDIIDTVNSYHGNCRCINEFRKIIKLLGI